MPYRGCKLHMGTFVAFLGVAAQLCTLNKQADI
jgi:hypothetical protein